MRRCFALLLLLTPVPVIAESATVALDPALCPVEATARRGAAGDLLAVRGTSGGSAPGLRLTLTPHDGKRVTEADVTVHALSARGRVWALGGNPEPDIVRSFTLADSGAGRTAFAAALALAEAGTVQWVEITALRYTDSTAWHAGTRGACRVTPEALTPVLARR